MKAQFLIALLGFASFGFTSCVTTRIKNNEQPRAESDWILPSRTLHDDIEARAEVLPWTNGRDRIDLITWFASVGEPAYDKLLGFLVDERPVVVTTALAALGATGDSRLVPYIRDAEQPTWEGTLLLESARTRVRLGDWSAMPILINGLESDEVFVRGLCAQSLYQATNEKLGFDAHASLPEREASIARWRAWWETRDSDELLAQN